MLATQTAIYCPPLPSSCCEGGENMDRISTKRGKKKKIPRNRPLSASFFWKLEFNLYESTWHKGRYFVVAWRSGILAD